LITLLGCVAVMLQCSGPVGEGPGRRPDSAPSADVPEAWQVVCRWLRGQADQLAEDLMRARGLLLTRAESEAPDEVRRLNIRAVKAPRSGWGLLPEILDDEPHRSPGAELLARGHFTHLREELSGCSNPG
jgi:hypothetical protein